MPYPEIIALGSPVFLEKTSGSTEPVLPN